MTAAPAPAARPSPLDRWMFEEFRADLRGLAVLRMLFAIHVLAHELPRYTAWIGMPDSFMAPPPGLGWFLHGYPDAWAIHAINAIIAFAAVCLLTGWRTGLASFTIGLMFLCGNTIAYAAGKVNHDILLIILPLTAAAAGWGRCYSIDARQSPRPAPPAWPLALLAMIIALAMLSSALPKITSGWLDPSTHASRGHIASRPFVDNDGTILTDLIGSIDSPLFWEFLDWATVFIEAAFVPALLRVRWFRIVAALAVGMHVGIWFTTEIYFSWNLLAYAALAAWPNLLDRRWAQRLLRAWQRAIDRLHPGFIVLIAIAVAAIYVTIGNPLIQGLSLLGLRPRWWLATTGCIVALALTASFVPWSGLRRRRAALAATASDH